MRGSIHLSLKRRPFLGFLNPTPHQLKRSATGASSFLTKVAANKVPGHAELAGIIPGKVFEVDLGNNEEFVSERYSFIAAEETVKLTI